MSRFKKLNKGFAIVLVLVLSAVLMLTSVSLYRSGHQYNYNIKKSFGELQAYYMALAAIQHAQLKVKYFPTELYDASEYSKGKNPMFDFTILSDSKYKKMSPIVQSEYASVVPHFHKASMSNLGPRFISDGTFSTYSTEKWFQLQSLDPKDSNLVVASWFPSGWPVDDKFKPVKNSDIYLWKYAHDITNLKAIQPALACDASKVATKVDKLDITVGGAKVKLPYEAEYQVQNMRVLSTANQQRLNEEVVSFVGVGSILLSPTAKPITCKITKRIKVRRN